MASLCFFIACIGTVLSAVWNYQDKKYVSCIISTIAATLFGVCVFLYIWLGKTTEVPCKQTLAGYLGFEALYLLEYVTKTSFECLWGHVTKTSKRCIWGHVTKISFWYFSDVSSNSFFKALKILKKANLNVIISVVKGGTYE